jgi:hypothetical protein
VVFLLFICWSVRNLTRNGTQETMDLLAPVVVTCSLAWAIWKRSTADMPGLVQVRLSPRGAIQVDNPGGGGKGVGNPKPWRDIVGVQIRSTGADTVRIKLLSRTTFWRGTDVPVDADVRCAAPEALVERVKAWRSPPPGDKSPRPT